MQLSGIYEMYHESEEVGECVRYTPSVPIRPNKAGHNFSSPPFLKKPKCPMASTPRSVGWMCSCVMRQFT